MDFDTWLRRTTEELRAHDTCCHCGAAMEVEPIPLCAKCNAAIRGNPKVDSFDFNFDSKSRTLQYPCRKCEHPSEVFDDDLSDFDPNYHYCGRNQGCTP